MQGEVILHNIVDLCTPCYIIIRIVMTLSSVKSFPAQCKRSIVSVNGMASQDDRPAVTVIDAAREGGR